MSPENLLIHQAFYRRLLAVTPPQHRERHGEQQVILFGDLLSNGESPLRLWIRALPDLVRVFGQDRVASTGHLARVLLGLWSFLPVALAWIVGWIWLDEYGDVSILFPLSALALFAQGGFTLLWLTPYLDRWRTQANALLLAGEAAALAAGSLVVLDSSVGPGRTLIGIVVATHALLGVGALVTSKRIVSAA